MGKGRAPCCDKNGVKRGPWSPAEDLRLITFIQKHGHDNWRALPKQAGLLRCGKSCRLRWINYLRPDVKRGNFTHDEEDTIIELHKTWGNKWSKIASRLPGRTDNEIKNVWNTHLKKRLQTTTNVSNSSGDEFKELSPTTSSSSSSSLLSSNENQISGPEKNDSMSKNPHGEVNNNEQFDPRSDPKEQMSSSVLSFESSNTSNSSSQVEIWWPEDPMDTQFEFLDFKNTAEEEEVEKKHMESESLGNIGIEIPFEGDIDFWKMLDLENIDLFEPNEAEVCEGSNFGGELENNKWFRYLENELGLDEMAKGGEEKSSVEETFLRENSAERSVDFEALHWSKSNPEVDPCMAYFQMGPPLTTNNLST